MVENSEKPSVFTNIKDVYGENPEAQKRYDSIKDKFTKRYGNPPLFFARAPGRVNIIGEHIDYCGYAVFPMALEQDIVIAVSTNKSGLYKMSNTNEKFSDFEVDVKNFTIDEYKWYNYVLCGHRAILDENKSITPLGMEILVDGNLPQSAGLSSSSALVTCSALASMHANSISMNKIELADSCTRCEAYIGTEGGGMDQAISILAKSGTAKLIEFNPLKATDVELPEGATFVIANSLRNMSKAENSGEYYNMRVSECRLAAQIISQKCGFEWRKTRRLVDTQNACGKTLEEMVTLVESLLHKEPYTRSEVCELLQIDDGELIKECLNPTTASAPSFKLYKRAKHVYSESARVLKYKQICDEKKPGSLELLGNLMNESQKSCSADYECSCDELDQLTQICREAGALGSRLTGAGWGGCTVSLVPSEIVDKFTQEVREIYYDVSPERKAKVAEALFATKPGCGAAILNNAA